MEKAAEKKTKPRYNPWQNAWWMMRRAWGIRIDTEELKFSGRSVVPMAAAEALCAVALATLELFCAPAVLRQVEGGGLSGLLLTVAFFCGGLMLVNALLRSLEANHMFARVFVRINIISSSRISLPPPTRRIRTAAAMTARWRGLGTRWCGCVPMC